MIRNSLLLLLSVTLLLVLTAQVQSRPQDGGTAAADPTEGSTYVGEAKCKKCHFKQHRSWKKSETYKHATAWETLKPQLKSPDQKDKGEKLCVSCHVTGHGQADRGGFVDAESSAHLLGVQCEACHGPGSKHVEAGEKAKAEKRKKFKPGEKSYMSKNVTACAGCHNPHYSHDKVGG
ncbi:MAG: multiheme c-type cytochrome [Planctomycetota bacterium]|jgi:cytochrome c553